MSLSGIANIESGLLQTWLSRMMMGSTQVNTLYCTHIQHVIEVCDWLYKEMFASYIAEWLYCVSEPG